MNTTIQNKKIAIIGAGISGLTVAKSLSQFNRVTVFDKSRSMGGRMATRRVDDYHFDHGAQFFTAKSKVFKDFLQTAKDDGVIEQWHCQFVEITKKKINRKWQFNDHNPHFVAKPQMNHLCKYMGKYLNILLSKSIESIHFDHRKWSLKTIAGEMFDDFDYLILAIPSHQAMNLVPKHFKYFDTLSKIKMSGCFTLMLGFQEDLQLDFEAALVKESMISWISVNSSKPERTKGFALVVHASNQWADDHIEEDLDSVKEKMMIALKAIIDFDYNAINKHDIHRWRYANASLREGRPSLFDANLNLGICGDWLISGRVEHAFLSGLNLYETITSYHF